MAVGAYILFMDQNPDEKPLHPPRDHGDQMKWNPTLPCTTKIIAAPSAIWTSLQLYQASQIVFLMYFTWET